MNRTWLELAHVLERLKLVTKNNTIEEAIMNMSLISQELKKHFDESDLDNIIDSLCEEPANECSLDTLCGVRVTLTPHNVVKKKKINMLEDSYWTKEDIPLTHSYKRGDAVFIKSTCRYLVLSGRNWVSISEYFGIGRFDKKGSSNFKGRKMKI